MILLCQSMHRRINVICMIARPIPKENVEALLSSAYVYAIASRAQFGFQITDQQIDYFKIDGTIMGWGQFRHSDTDIVDTKPIIAVQLKASTKAYYVKDHVHYNLDVETFEDFSSPHTTPHIFILLVLPKNSDEWISHTTDALISRKCAYWCSLLDYPRRPKPGQKNITIKIPICNHFSVEQLKEIMGKLARGKRISYGNT